MVDLKTLQEQSHSRANRWHENDWSLLEWTGAMCGEAGESANFAKKLKRIDDQIANNDKRMFGKEVPLEEQRSYYKHQTAKEAADTIMYAILVIDRCGLNAEEVCKDVFNTKSEEYGFPERI